jgi:hypothetical protein
MEAVEDFMRELLAARVAEEERILVTWRPFRSKFFTADCPWDNREGTLEGLRTEEVVSVTVTGTKANVITRAIHNQTGVRKQRLRYLLTAVDNKWRVWHVEVECPACGGNGDQTCVICKGNGWI